MTLAKRSKYGARKTTRDGYTFDSLGEANRWTQLQLLQRSGAIKGLGEPHPVFPITLNGVTVCKVEMDFAYQEAGVSLVEDYKGQDTPISRLKRKLLAAAYPHLTIRITGPAAVRAARAARKPRAPRKVAAKAKGRGV